MNKSKRLCVKQKVILYCKPNSSVGKIQVILLDIMLILFIELKAIDAKLILVRNNVKSESCKVDS